MPRFNSLQELDKWRRGQGPSSEREAIPKPNTPPAPDPQPNGNTAPDPLDHTSSSDMSMGEMPPMPRGSFIMRFRRLIPALTWVTAAIALLVIWNLIAPFTAEIVIWIGSNASLLSLGVAILAITGYVVALHRQVHEVLPQDILTLRADAMRRLDAIESSERISGKSSAQTSGTSTASQEQPPIQSQGHTTIQKEFEQWMQSDQPTPSP
ncbi:MAG TPA: hypothetical protein EYN74_09285 [Nitrospirales bacterium]|nr:hypothetical protein [Nitrospirales bacterium]